MAHLPEPGRNPEQHSPALTAAMLSNMQNGQCAMPQPLCIHTRLYNKLLLNKKHKHITDFTHIHNQEISLDRICSGAEGLQQAREILLIPPGSLENMALLTGSLHRH